MQAHALPVSPPRYCQEFASTSVRNLQAPLGVRCGRKVERKVLPLVHTCVEHIKQGHACFGTSGVNPHGKIQQTLQGVLQARHLQAW